MSINNFSGKISTDIRIIKLIVMKAYILKGLTKGNAPGLRAAVAEVVVFLCILLFAYAAFSKLMDFSNFQLQLGRSPYISPFAAILAWLIPAAETASALMMVFSRSRKYGLYIFTILMAAFTLYIGFMLLFSKNTPCVCGGIISGFSWFYHMIFNLGFLLLGISAIRNHHKNNDHPY